MGVKPVSLIKWKKWLRKLGLVHIRTQGSHEIWDFPDDSLIRPVIFRSTKKEIPGMHIYTNLKTLGIDTKQFEKEIKSI